MSNLPRILREQMQKHYSLHTVELVEKQGAGDTTQKFLWRLTDHSLIESVLIPASPALYGEPSDRHTLCVSTQVGCAYGCKFCASGLEGLKRNLGVEEIVEQVLAVERWHAKQSKVQSLKSQVGNAATSNLPRHASRITHHASISNEALVTNERSSGLARLITNVVIMGMGEPLAN